MKTESPSLLEYAAMLSQHDWFYSFSDDHSVWTAGNARAEELKNLSTISPEHETLYKMFCAFIRILVQAPPEESNNLRAKFLSEKTQFLETHAKRPTSPK